jgi:hypothetical protein
VEAVWRGKTSADLFALAGAAGMSPEEGDAVVAKIESLRPLLAAAEQLPLMQEDYADASAKARRVVDANVKEIGLLAGEIQDALVLVGRAGQELRRVREAVIELASALAAGLLPIDFTPLSVLAWDATEQARLAKDRGQQDRLRDAQVAVERARRKAAAAREAEKFVSALDAPAGPAPIAPAAQDSTAVLAELEKVKADLAPTT